MSEQGDGRTVGSRVGEFARWARMGNNRRRDAMTEQTAVHDEEMMRDAGATAESSPLSETAGDGAVDTHEDGGGAAGASLQVELEQARGERDALKDRLARLQAEFDNARKREAKERQDARDFAVQRTVEPFLGVMDNFGLALKAEGSAEQLKAGVEMILRQMEDALRGLQVQAVESVGMQFDPKVHEALGSVATKEFPDHQVLEEIRRGYQLRDKLLRPALVRIASNPDQVSD